MVSCPPQFSRQLLYGSWITRDHFTSVSCAKWYLGCSHTSCTAEEHVCAMGWVSLTPPRVSQIRVVLSADWEMLLLRHPRACEAYGFLAALQCVIPSTHVYKLPLLMPCCASFHHEDAVIMAQIPCAMCSKCWTDLQLLIPEMIISESSCFTSKKHFWNFGIKLKWFHVICPFQLLPSTLLFLLLSCSSSCRNSENIKSNLFLMLQDIRRVVCLSNGSF